MTDPVSPKSAGEMMTDILGNVSNLVRNETDLARAEIAQSMKKAAASLASMALALVLAIAGINVLALAVVALVVHLGVPPPWAPVVVGAGLLLVAAIVFSMAKSALNQIGFVPTRTARSVSRDVAAIKDSFNDR